MTRDRAKELLLVIQAFAEGKAIQRRGKEGFAPGKWEDCSLLSADSTHLEYRIKPEKQKRWVNVYHGRCIAGAHMTREEADSSADPRRIACVEIEFEEGQGL